jgi:predicted esterase YcpF (UPF0227 family)
MKHIRKYNESNSFSFSDEKDKVLDMINSLMEEYEKFTKTVSPKNWRTTGHHFTELRKMKEDIVNFSELTEKEKENEWVRKQTE